MSYVLNTPYSTQTLFLNSRNCTGRQDADGNNIFKYYLNQSIKAPTNAKILMTFQDACIPNLIENIRAYNNKLSFLLVEPNKTEHRTTIQFPTGIYNVYTFRDYINFRMSLIPDMDITCIYNDKKFKLEFISTNRIYIINETNYPTTCGNVIGVGKDTANQFIFPVPYNPPLYTITMPSYFNFSGTPYIFLNIEGLTITNLDSRGNIDGTLVRIPVNANFGEIIYYRPPELISFIIHRPSIHSIDFVLQDHNNRPINIGSLDFQITLKFDIYFPPEIRELDEGTIGHTLRLQQLKETTAKEVKTEEGLGV